MSFILLGIPQKRKSIVTTMKGIRCSFLTRVAAGDFGDLKTKDIKQYLKRKSNYNLYYTDDETES